MIPGIMTFSGGFSILKLSETGRQEVSAYRSRPARHQHAAAPSILDMSHMMGPERGRDVRVARCAAALRARELWARGARRSPT